MKSSYSIFLYGDFDVQGVICEKNRNICDIIIICKLKHNNKGRVVINMKKTVKKIMCLILTAIMVFSSVDGNAFASGMGIVLNEYEITLQPGETEYIWIDKYGFSGGTENYMSMDEDVATVDGDGLITAKNPGKTDIYVTCTYGWKTYMDYCTVIVKQNCKLSKTRLYLYKKQSYKLKVKGYSGKAKWKSSNKKVATVKNGKVTAKRKGRATIYCTVKGKKLKCKVRVYNPQLNYTTRYVTQGFNAKVSIWGKSRKGKWWTSNKSIATVNSKGNVHGVKPGKATLYCKTDGVVLKCKIIVQKNEGTFKKNYKGFYGVPYDTVGYNVLKIYFEGNAMKVKIKMFNKTAYTLKKYEYSKFKFKIDGAKTFRKEIFNVNVNVKPFSTKVITVTLSTNPYYRKHYDFRNNYYTIWWIRNGSVWG